MKVLVLGAQGQLGCCLSEQLGQTAHEIILTSRAEIDITNFSATRIKVLQINPDIVINAIGYTAVDKAEGDADQADLVNHVAVANIAAICAEIESVLIHISTDFVFKGDVSTPYREDSEPNPESVYGRTKLLGELAVMQSGCRYLIFRTAWIFSEHGNNFLKTMLRLGGERSELSIVNDQIGCPTYAQDIAKIIVAALVRIEQGQCEYGIYHYCGDTPCSWYDFAVQIFDEARNYGLSVPILKPILTSKYPTQAQRPRYSALDSVKAAQAFGVSSSDWVSGIKRVLFLSLP